MSKKNSYKNEFRKNKVSGHPAYICQKIGKEYKYIGITHSPITRNVKNIPLSKSPNPNDKKTTYVKPQVEKLKTNKFRDIEKGWAFSEKDKKIISRLRK